MLSFIIVGAAGLVILVLSMIVGEILDLFDGILSGTALGVALSLFGASGMITLSMGAPIWVAYVVAAALGFIGILISALLTKFLKGNESEKSYEVVGLAGIAISDITPEIGEVQLDHPEELDRRLAYASSTIPSGTTINVVAVHGPKLRVEASQS